MVPNSEKTECVFCSVDTIKPDLKGSCQQCPVFTMSNEERTVCFARDVVVDQNQHMINMYKIQRFDLFCQEEENFHACDDEETNFVGPIKFDESSTDNSQPIFYFAHKEPLKTERYEFHKSRYSKVAESSFIYMLYDVEHVEIGQVEEYLKVDQETLNSIDMIQQGETN